MDHSVVFSKPLNLDFLSHRGRFKALTTEFKAHEDFPLAYSLISSLFIPVLICVLTTLHRVFHRVKACVWLPYLLFIFVMLRIEPRVLCMLGNIHSQCFMLTQNLAKLPLSFKTWFKFHFNLTKCFLFLSSLSYPPVEYSSLSPGYHLAVIFNKNSYFTLCFVPFWGCVAKTLPHSFLYLLQ